MRRLALLAAVLPALGFAQYQGPAVQTCRAHALAEEKQAAANIADLQFDRDRHLNIARYTRKLGSQFVASVLFGNGAILLKAGPPVEMTFVCLLADEKRALFFFWVPRRDAPVLAQCRRGGAPGECIDTLLAVTEQDLTTIYAQRLVEAREADAGSGGESRTVALRKSNDAFRAYLEAECGRRGPAGSEPLRACVVELTRRRALDLQ